MNCIIYRSPAGALTLKGTETAVESIKFGSHGKSNPNPLLEEAAQQLEEYFQGERKKLTFPIKISGTEFQKKVWNALARVPFGKTVSYRELAEKVGSPKASRAIGNAMAKNNHPLIIPCHRVVTSSGKMGGFGGGIRWKRELLELEGNHLEP